MIIRVPNDPMLYQSAYSDTEKFIRDIACWPRTGIQPFIRRRRKVKECIKDYPNPFNPESISFDPDFVCKDNFRRYMHIDLAKNRDAVGISMVHVPYFVEREIIEETKKRRIKTKVPHIKCDFWGRVTVRKGEEIVLADIREAVYELSRRKFYFGLITFDRFQSLDSIQTLRNSGYVSGNFSIDRTTSILELESVYKLGETKNPLGYNKRSTEGNYNYAVSALKDVIYDDRFEVPATATKYYDKDYFFEEAINAQEERGKVDHPPRGSLDVFQSIAGGVTHAITNERFTFIGESEEEYSKLEDPFYKVASEIDKILLTSDPLYTRVQDPRDID